MEKIKELPEEIRRILSASEVIENSDSVVKELIENSIDSGASEISIQICDAGYSSISVKDNGSGMVLSDIINSVRQYHTSKTLSVVDAYSPKQMGFRGEALFSIASVSQMTIISSCGSETWQVIFEGGNLLSQRPHSFIGGTSVTVNNLFYNTPGRREYSQKAAKQTSIIKKMVQEFCIAYPSISFSLFSNGRKLNIDLLDKRSNLENYFKLSPDRHQISKKTQMEFNQQTWDVELITYLSQTNSTLIVLNGRIINIPWMIQILKKSFGIRSKNYRENFSLYMNITCQDIKEGIVNFNYHPRKKEVLFNDEENLKAKFYNLFLEVFDDFFSFDKYDFGISSEIFGNLEGGFLGVPLGQIHDSWIISHNENDMFIIDQHAVHERLIFERMKKQILIKSIPLNQKTKQKQLQHPVFIDDGVSVVFGYEKVQKYLEKLGFSFYLDEDSLYLECIPSFFLESVDWASILREFLDEVSLSRSFDGESLMDKIYDFSNRACKMAIKANSKLSMAEMNSLLREVEQTPGAQFCNHGRPSIKKLTNSQIRTLFDR